MQLRGTPDQWLAWLAGTDPQSWKEATLILGGLTPEDDVPIEVFVDALQSGDHDIVFWSVIALSRLQHRSRPAVPELVRIAGSHEQFGVRQVAVHALAAVNPENQDAKAAVLLALNDTSPSVRREALQALISIRDLSADELMRIKEMEKDADETVARWSEIALRNIRLRSQRRAK